MYRFSIIRSGQIRTVQILSQSGLRTEDGQALLRDVSEKRIQVHCLCRGTYQTPLFPRHGVNGILHLVRVSGTKSEHALWCVHGDESKFAETFGAPKGSIISRDGNICVDFDLLFPAEVNLSGKSGQWNGLPRDDSPALRSILWLSLVRSGLNLSLPDCVRENPWSDLLAGATNIVVRGANQNSNLAELLLLPAEDNSEAGSMNYKKLRAAAIGGRRVLSACILPPFTKDSADRDVVSFKHCFDVTMEIPRSVLIRALGQMPFSQDWHISKKWVLAFGLAKVRMDGQPNDQKSRAIAKINQLVLMPVSFDLNPFPTVQHSDRFDQLIAAKGIFTVSPREDPLILMRLGRGKGIRPDLTDATEYQ